MNPRPLRHDDIDAAVARGWNQSRPQPAKPIVTSKVEMATVWAGKDRFLFISNTARQALKARP